MEDPAIAAATDYDTLRERIIAARADMPKRLAQVAGFVIAHPDEIALGTVSSIARQAGVQPSTLVRFAQKFDFSGFSDLQVVYRRKLQQRWPDYQDRIKTLRTRTSDDPGSDLVAAFSEATINSILRQRETLDAEKISDAAQTLAKAETIYLAGNRRTFPAASYLAYLFGKLGMRHRLITGLADMNAFEMADATSRDTLIAISFTPYTPATVELAENANTKGIAVIAITDSTFSPIARLSKVCLEVVEEDYAGFRSLGATFCLCMALATYAAELRSKNGRAPREVP